MSEISGSTAVKENPAISPKQPEESKAPLATKKRAAKKKTKKAKKQEICKLRDGTTVFDLQLLVRKADTVNFNPDDNVLTLENVELRNVFYTNKTGSDGKPEKHIEDVFIDAPGAESVRLLINAGPHQRLTISSVNDLLRQVKALPPEEQEEFNRKMDGVNGSH